jgi:UDP-glucose 4-epimerase
VGGRPGRTGEHDRRLRRPAEHRGAVGGHPRAAERPARHPNLQEDQRPARAPPRTGLSIINLRISGVWGPGGHLPNFAFPAPQYVYAAATGTPVDLGGVGGRLHADDGLDLCYVHDIGRAIALLQSADTLEHRTYNIASGRVTTNREVVDAIRTVVPEFRVDLPDGATVPSNYLDITRLNAATGYVPEWDTERAVADYVAWFRAGNKP